MLSFSSSRERIMYYETTCTSTSTALKAYNRTLLLERVVHALICRIA
jgi:hypothetical protein